MLSTATYPQVFPVIFDHKPYTIQPRDGELGVITNRLKRKPFEYTTLEQFLKKVGSGKSFIPSNSTGLDVGFQFHTTQLITIDVDDTHRVTDPVEVAKKHSANGLYYTFSHGIKGNRYRLVFLLDQPVNDLEIAVGITKHLLRKLKSDGIPVDENVNRPNAVGRGGKGYEYLHDVAFSTSAIIEEVKVEQANIQKRIQEEAESKYPPITFDVLRRMAETIGHIPTKSGRTEEWTKLVASIRNHELAGGITEQEGLELFHIISGGESPDRTYTGWKVSGRSSIGTFIDIARNYGFQFNLHDYNPKETTESIEHSTWSIDQYIPTEKVQALFGTKKSYLIDSPTGSGKTTSIVRACLNLSKPNSKFFVLAFPTVTLTEQVAKDHGILGIQGSSMTAKMKQFAQVANDVRAGRRVFATTYDMAPILCEWLQKISGSPDFGFDLIVDEYHKFIFDYGYRASAISGLFALKEKALTFIGLSGTPEEIDRKQFDHMIKVRKSDMAVPTNQIVVYHYEKKKEWLSDLSKVLEVWSTKRRMLVFLNSKESIEILQKTLKRRGISVGIVTSESKSNAIYKQLVEQGTVPDKIRVLIATNVIADGVSIKNDFEWETLVVANQHSKIYNPSTIRQMTNRFRNQFSRVSLYMQLPKSKEENSEKRPFPFEASQNMYMNRANRIVRELEGHIEKSYSSYFTGVIERRYGILLNEEKGFHVNDLLIRYFGSNDQLRYYMSNPFAFVRAVCKITGLPLRDTLNISQAIKKRNLETALSEIEAELEQQREENQIKNQSVGEAFTQEVYTEMLAKKPNDQIISEFTKKVLPRHIRCLEKLMPYTPSYEVAKQIVSQVQSDRQTYAFINDIRRLIEVYNYFSHHRNNVTMKVFKALLDLNRPMTNQEYIQKIKKIAKGRKITVEDVKKVESLVVFKAVMTRDKGDRKAVRKKQVAGPLTAEIISERYDIPLVEIKSIAEKVASEMGNKSSLSVSIKMAYISSDTKTEQLNIFSAV